MKFLVYTLDGKQHSTVAAHDKVNALPAREALQAMYIIGAQLMLKLPSADGAGFRAQAFTWAEGLSDTFVLTSLTPTEFQRCVLAGGLAAFAPLSGLTIAAAAEHIRGVLRVDAALRKQPHTEES